MRIIPLAVALSVLAAAAPSRAPALEPRFDHRDMHGPFAEVLVAHDSVARSGIPTTEAWRPAVRAGWGFDVTGEGNDLLVGGTVALRWPDDPNRMHVRASVDARYRAYFGTEELKTFLDLGAWVPVSQRLAVGPLAGLGLAWDFGRGGGVYASAAFATAFGQARIASVEVSAGAQLRFAMF